MRSKELKYNPVTRKTLIAIIDETKANPVRQYVVCSNYDPYKRYGEQWDHGHYFGLGGANGNDLREAENFLYQKEWVK